MAPTSLTGKTYYRYYNGQYWKKWITGKSDEKSCPFCWMWKWIFIEKLKTSEKIRITLTCISASWVESIPENVFLPPFLRTWGIHERDALDLHRSWHLIWHCEHLAAARGIGNSRPAHSSQKTGFVTVQGWNVCVLADPFSGYIKDCKVFLYTCCR